MPYDSITYQGKLGRLAAVTFDIIANYDSLTTSLPDSSKPNASHSLLNPTKASMQNFLRKRAKTMKMW
jgi:hypothetical protein